MISGNYYRAYWRMQNDDKVVVIVQVKYMVDNNTANTTIIKGNFEKFSAHIHEKDVIEKFGNLKEFQENHPEYWV